MGAVAVQAEQAEGTAVLRRGRGPALGAAGLPPARPSEEGCAVPDRNSSAELVLKIVTDVSSVTPNTLLKIRCW